MKITFAEDGWSEYLYWQTQDKKIVKKIKGKTKRAEIWALKSFRDRSCLRME